MIRYEVEATKTETREVRELVDEYGNERGQWKKK